MIDTTELRAALERQLERANNARMTSKHTKPYWDRVSVELYRIRSSLEIIEEILNG